MAGSRLPCPLLRNRSRFRIAAAVRNTGFVTLGFFWAHPMRKEVIAVVSVSTVLFGCAASPPRDDGASLLHPPGLSLEQRQSNMRECYRSAVNDARAKPALTVAEKTPLQGRSTLKFFHRGNPVTNSEWTPSMMSPTLSGYLGEQGNNEVTDRYVLCFLSRGYTWPSPKASN